MNKYIKNSVITFLLIVFVFFLPSFTCTVNSNAIDNVKTIRGSYNINNLAKQQAKKVILKFEGGLTKDKMTNKGIEYTTFVYLSKKLNYNSSYQHFLEMPDSTWNKVFDAFWHEIGADTIKNKKIKVFSVDFAWNSGIYAFKNVIRLYQSKHGSINNSDPSHVFNYLYNERKKFMLSAPIIYHQGLLNRLNYFIKNV